MLLCALKEITEASLTQNTETDEVTNLFHTLQNVFQKILECVARRLKKQQEEGIQVSYYSLNCYLMCRWIHNFYANVFFEVVTSLLPTVWEDTWLNFQLNFLNFLVINFFCPFLSHHDRRTSKLQNILLPMILDCASTSRLLILSAIRWTLSIQSKGFVYIYYDLGGGRSFLYYLFLLAWMILTSKYVWCSKILENLTSSQKSWLLVFFKADPRE